MKKKNFLSGFGAKSALVAVALTTMVFTSCEKEEFNVEPVELAPASAKIYATVYDLSDGQVLAPTKEVKEIKADANGAIVAKTEPVQCPTFPNSEKYLSVADISVAVPALEKGQFAYIPASFYAQLLTSAAQDVTVIEDPHNVETTSKDNPKSKSYGPFGVTALQEIEYTAQVGQKITNLEEVYSYIDNNIPEGRAIDAAEVKKVLKATVSTYNPGIKEVTVTDKIEIAKDIIVEFQPTTTIIKSVISISATVDGVNYNVPNIKIEKAGATVVKQIVIDHGHGHGHGTNSNAGGGAGGK